MLLTEAFTPSTESPRKKVSHYYGGCSIKPQQGPKNCSQLTYDKIISCSQLMLNKVERMLNLT